MSELCHKKEVRSKVFFCISLYFILPLNTRGHLLILFYNHPKNQPLWFSFWDMQSKKYRYWSSPYPTHLKGLYLYHHLSSLAQPKVHQSLLGRNLCRLWHNQHKPWMVWCCLYHNRSFCNQHWSSKEHWRIAKYREDFHLSTKCLILQRLKNRSLYHEILFLQKFNDILVKDLKTITKISLQPQRPSDLHYQRSCITLCCHEYQQTHLQL